MRVVPLVALAAILLGVIGCHSAYIETTVTNGTPQTLQLVEVDYPSASFGTQNLAPGASFHYRFKILGNGPTKLLYTDSTRHDRTIAVPTLTEGLEGTLLITISDPTPQWHLEAHTR